MHVLVLIFCVMDVAFFNVNQSTSYFQGILLLLTKQYTYAGEGCLRGPSCGGFRI